MWQCLSIAFPTSISDLYIHVANNAKQWPHLKHDFQIHNACHFSVSPDPKEVSHVINLVYIESGTFYLLSCQKWYVSKYNLRKNEAEKEADYFQAIMYLSLWPVLSTAAINTHHCGQCCIATDVAIIRNVHHTTSRWLDEMPFRSSERSYETETSMIYAILFRNCVKCICGFD